MDEAPPAAAEGGEMGTKRKRGVAAARDGEPDGASKRAKAKALSAGDDEVIEL